MIGEVLIKLLQAVVIKLLLYGIVLALATPFILIPAPFRQGGIRGGYAAIDDAFHDWF